MRFEIDLVRIVDESGEDYLYHKSLFVFVDLPKKGCLIHSGVSLLTSGRSVRNLANQSFLERYTRALSIGRSRVVGCFQLIFSAQLLRRLDVARSASVESGRLGKAPTRRFSQTHSRLDFPRGIFSSSPF